MAVAGKQFGLLIALSELRENGRKKWLCQCRCGNKKTVREESLLSGKAKSCGCASTLLRKAKVEKRYGLVNQKFGRLLVLWRAKEGDGRSRSMMWECRCDCGKQVKVSGNNLRNGKTKSCGCLQSESTLESGEYEQFKTYAERQGIPWFLTKSEFDSITGNRCVYCGQIASTIVRLNNKAGFVLGNVAPCCGVHGRMKGTQSHAEFVAACMRVVKHMEATRK
jgi:hypothetical protein